MPDEKKNYRRYLSVKYSFPLAVVKHLDSLYGREATESILNFYNTEKYTDITVNTLKITVNDYIKELSAVGVTAEQNALAPKSLRISSSVNPERLPGFDKGYFFVQDRASAICSEVLYAKENELIIDVCSAPGGKSLASAILSSDKADIYSFDLHESKLSLIEESVTRLGLTSITVSQRDATEPNNDLIGKADKVICDVPCSGLGVLGKKPDLRYKDLSVAFELPEFQLSILTASAQYLKQGGTLVYSTCTLNPEENESVVSQFLENNHDFELTPFKLGDTESKDGMLTLLPHVHHTDGFFIAKIIRK